ncbi:MAG: molybdopterin dehydrogenase [Spirochaetaceae bacterium]|nr:MAG: molybdopterin dehydrogenase [Spirochaetaceae bacterium]
MSTPAWIRPATLKEALTMRRDYNARPLAGATDIYVRHRAATGTLPPLEDRPVLYVGHLPELTSISEDGKGWLRIGAATVYTDILEHPDTPLLLRRAIEELAAPALRNAGTLGGNIGNASPAADAVCALYALHAEVDLAGHAGERRVPIAQLITGPGKTTVGADELITAVSVPMDRPGSFHYYRKAGTRRANALSKIAFCAGGTVLEGRLTGLGVAVGAVGPTIVHSRDLEVRAEGSDLARYRKLQQEESAPGGFLTARYMALISPISDQRSTDAYRRRVTENLLRDLFERTIPTLLSGKAG